MHWSKQDKDNLVGLMAKHTHKQRNTNDKLKLRVLFYHWSLTCINIDLRCCCMKSNNRSTCSTNDTLKFVGYSSCETWFVHTLKCCCVCPWSLKHNAPKVKLCLNKPTWSLLLCQVKLKLFHMWSVAWVSYWEMCSTWCCYPLSNIEVVVFVMAFKHHEAWVA